MVQEIRSFVQVVHKIFRRLVPRTRCSASRSGVMNRRAGAHNHRRLGPGSAEQREGRCTASGTRAISHQTKTPPGIGRRLDSV